MAAKATPGTVEFGGTSYNVSTSLPYASFYACTSDSDEGLMIRFHRSEKSAQRGTWDSPAMRKTWKHVGYAQISR